jgi:hypothetical protein
MSDLNDFEECWKDMSNTRLADSVSIAKSEVPTGKAAPKKRKPTIAK